MTHFCCWTVATRSIYTSLLHNVQQKLAVTLIVGTFFLHPHLTQNVFQLLACESIQYGETRLALNLNMYCTHAPPDGQTLGAIAKEFIPWLTLGLVAFFLFVVGIPLIACWKLVQHRKTMHTSATRHRYGFLYLGYEERFYWWEIWVIYRKALLYMVTVVLDHQSANLQMITALLIVVVIILVQLFCQPYENLFFDYLEQTGLAACASLYILALYFHNVEHFTTELSLMVISTIVAVVINLVFFVLWLKSTLRYVGAKIDEFRYTDHYEHVRRVSSFYAFIRPCEPTSKNHPCEQTPLKVINLCVVCVARKSWSKVFFRHCPHSHLQLALARHHH